MNPWLSLPGGLSLPTYPVAATVAVVLATFVFREEARRGGLAPSVVMDGVLVAIVTSAVGARAFHLLVESPRDALDPWAWVSPYAPWTFYGGLVGGLLGVAAVARWRGVSAWRALDVVAVGVPFIQAISRLGCLAAGCCHGRLATWPLGAAVPWAVRYDHHGELPAELLAVPLHPAPLYLSMFHVALFLGLRVLRGRQGFDGQVLAVFLVAYGLGRGLLDVFRGDDARGFLLGASTAQWTGLFAVGLGFVLYRRLSVHSG